MSALPLDNRGRALKAASSDLLSDITVKRAEDFLSKGKSQLYRCGSINDESQFLDVRDVAELERRAARPLVTMELCRQAGGVFLPLPEDFGDGGELTLHIVELAGEMGDVSNAVSAALADGDVSAGEAAEIEAQLNELIEKAVQVRAAVQGMQGRSAVAVVGGERRA